MAITETQRGALRVEPVHLTVGAIVHGVDAKRPLDDETVAFVHQALLDHKVLFFRDQFVDLDEQQRFVRHFGELRRHPIHEYPDWEWLEGGGVRVRAENWHSDLAFLPEPYFGTSLSLPVQPDNGGDTMWADLEAAYHGLAAPVREMVEQLTALHDGENFQDWAWGPNVDDVRRLEILSWAARKVPHPLVQVHPETGRKSLFAVTGFARKIIGLNDAESDGILSMLAAHSTQAEYVVRWRWRPGDLVFWDNRVLLHRAANDYGTAKRTLQRALVH